MGKEFLAYDGKRLTDPFEIIYPVSRVEYLKRRLQFWKYYKHHTMGRPLIRPKATKGESSDEN